MDPKDVVRTVEELWGAGKLDELDHYFDPAFASHSSVPGLPPTLATAKMAHQMSMQAFPDRRTEIQDIVAEGDKVAVRVRLTGTNTGGLPWFGVGANGAKVDFEFMAIYQVRDGKIVGHWGVNDLAILIQLGAFTPPAM